jgi:hypothetical protein
MPTPTLSNDEIKLIIDMIDNQLDLIYNNVQPTRSCDFINKRIELLLNMKKNLEKYED